MNDTMTVKELAEVAGVNPRTVYRAVRKLGFDMQHGVEAKFDHAQCLRVVGLVTAKHKSVSVSQALMTPVQSQKAIKAPSQNGKLPSQNLKVPRQIGEVQPEIVKAFTEALQVMNKMADACLAMAAKVQSAPALPAPAEPEYVTIAGFCNIRRLNLSPEAIARAGRVASAIAQDRGITIGKAPHERWGYVNTYPVSICAEAVAA